MVDRPGITVTEIAERYGRSRSTVSNTWRQHPAWATIRVLGRRGRAVEYDRDDADRVIREHFVRPASARLEPRRHYTAREAADAGRLSYNTIRSDISRDRWPAPDATDDHGTKLWLGATINAELDKRQARRA